MIVRIEKLIHSFMRGAGIDCGKIHNERALQLELAYMFRKNGLTVTFEERLEALRPKGSTAKPKTRLDLKVELEQHSAAIELKVPLNGQHPETMYSFCMDIEFIESLIKQRIVDRGYCLMMTNDKAFWKDSGRGSPIHNSFRIGKIEGKITKPTGQQTKKTAVVLSGSYQLPPLWRNVEDTSLLKKSKYLLLPIYSMAEAAP